MHTYTKQARVEEVMQIFELYGFGNSEILEDWDGRDVDELATLLTEEEFQTLLDELQQRDE